MRSAEKGFSAVESLVMLAAIFAFTWICLGMLHKQGSWPFKRAAVEPKPAQADSAVEKAQTRDR